MDEKINLVNALHVEVNCENNTPEKIAEGGHPILGYDFYVDANENFEELKGIIEFEIKSNNQPLISINNKGIKEIEGNRIFSRKRVKAAIKQDYRDLIQ